MKTQTTMSNAANKQDALKRLSSEYDKLQRTARSKYNDRVYMNLPVTRLERTFFGLLADRMGLDKTKLLRRVISAFMRRYPSIVLEAKELIDADLDTGDN